MWNFLGQGSNPRQNSNASHCSDNARFLIHCATKELQSIYVTYTAVLASDVQQSDSEYIYIYIYIFYTLILCMYYVHLYMYIYIYTHIYSFADSFPSELLQYIEYSSPYYK